jgi:hypothetical protein
LFGKKQISISYQFRCEEKMCSLFPSYICRDQQSRFVISVTFKSTFTKTLQNWPRDFHKKSQSACRTQFVANAAAVHFQCACAVVFIVWTEWGLWPRLVRVDKSWGKKRVLIEQVCRALKRLMSTNTPSSCNLFVVTVHFSVNSGSACTSLLWKRDAEFGVCSTKMLV